MKRLCGTCKFFYNEPGATPHCRRALNAVDGASSSFPVTHESMWCWQYKRSVWRWLKRIAYWHGEK